MKNAVLLIFVLLFCSCHGEEDYGIKPTIDGKPIAKIQMYSNKADFPMEKINLSEFVDSVKFIRLETTEESLINNINTVFFVDDEVVIVDKMSGKILVFDNNGNYIRKIANRGRGPGEYLGITSCNYDNERRQLSIYDDSTHKLLLYDLLGNFIKEILIDTAKSAPMRAPIRDMVNLPNGHYLCYNELISQEAGDCSGLWEIDSDGNFVRNIFKYDITIPFVYNRYYSYFQTLLDRTTAVRDILHNDIYYYKNGKIIKYISWDIMDNILMNYIGQDFSEETFSYCLTIQDKNGYVIGTWIDKNGQPTYFRYNKNHNKIGFAETFDNSDIDAVWTHKVIDSNLNNALLIDLSSMSVTRMLKQESTPPHTKEILNRLNAGMSEAEIEKANPIIEILYLKK